MKLLLQQSLSEEPSFLEELSAEDDLVTEDLYAIFTIAPSRILHLERSRLLKSCQAQQMSCDDMYGHPLSPAGERRKLSLLKLSESKACNGLLDRFGKRYALPGLHMSYC